MSRHEIDKVNQSTANSPALVFEEIHTVMHLLRARQFRVFRHCPYRLTHMEGKILGYFGQHPGATLSELAAHTGRDKGQLARLIKTLRQHDLLAAATDATDKRSVKLQLTAEGRKICTTLQKELEAATAEAVSSLKAADRGTLVRLLRQLRAGIEAE